MKNIILLGLAVITFGVFGLNFAYAHHDGDEYGDDYWYDEYWQDDPYYHHYDHYWAYYPHGYYCVYYVWYHPWWWDWYWYRCHWCHEWDWYFFGAGYYIVWFEGEHCYWRPRYGRYVRYELHYSYNDFKYRAHEYGHNLPDKPPRQIDIPYNEKEVMRLTKEKDPELYRRLEKEEKNGNLEKMRKDYEVKQRKEIEVKNEEYRLSKSKVNLDEKSFADQRSNRVIDREPNTTKTIENRKYYNDNENDNENGYNDKAKNPNVEKRDWSEYYEDEDQNKNDKGSQDQEEYDKPDNRNPNRDDSYDRNDDNNSDREKENDNNKARNNNKNSVPDKGGNGSGNTDNSSRERSARPSPGARR